MKIEPTKDEKRNGWEKPELNKYLEQRTKVQAQKIYNGPPKREVESNHRYDPKRWRE